MTLVTIASMESATACMFVPFETSFLPLCTMIFLKLESSSDILLISSHMSLTVAPLTHFTLALETLDSVNSRNIEYPMIKVVLPTLESMSEVELCFDSLAMFSFMSASWRFSSVFSLERAF